MGPSLIELSAAVHSKLVCCCLNSIRTLSSADLTLQDTGALQQQSTSMVGYHSRVGTLPSFSGLAAASTAAGRRISAGAPPRPSTRVHLLAFVCFAYPACALYPRFSRKL